MNVAENMLLQVQGMASLPKTGSTGAKDKTGSFQDLMDQAGKDSVDTGKEPKDPSTTDQPANSEKTEGESAPKAPVQKKDGQKVDETQIDPNAVLLTMFRPEIVEVQPETMEAVAETLETVVPVGGSPGDGDGGSSGPGGDRACGGNAGGDAGDRG